MQEEELVGLARVVLYRRERLLMLQPRGKGIVGTLLRYKNEVRDEHDYFDDIPNVKVSKDMLELAEHILETKKTKFDPSQVRGPLRDRAQEADQRPSKPARSRRRAPEPQPTNVINLMDALRRSVKAGRGAPPAPAAGDQGSAQGRVARGAAASKRKKLKRAS